MSRTLRVLGAETVAGRRLRARIAGRLESVLDRGTERASRRIVDSVRRGGDAELVARTRELDGEAVSKVEELRLAPSRDDRDGRQISSEERDAVERAIFAAESVHRGQLESGRRTIVNGLAIEELVRPLGRVGVYVPGGRAAYPSTAILTVVPARVAGVAEIAVATPVRGWRASPLLRFTLARLGVEEVWGFGGAQAIAALAFGTESVPAVDAIVGPGSSWVTAAKRLVAGRVAIDGLMGPSEVVLVAGPDADAELIAADLLAQAEHDPKASALLVTTSRPLALRVSERVDGRLEGLATRATASRALRDYGGALIVEDLDSAARAVEEMAPEHLQLVGAEPEAAAERFERAGAVFVGADAPEVLGDYVAGSSHVLPTCGTARFASGLSVRSFQRRLHRIRSEAPGTRREAPGTLARAARDAAVLAAAEGLPAHAASARLRAGGLEAGDGRR